MSTIDPLFVVAQNYQRFVYWCRQKGYRPHDGSVIYVRDAAFLKGRSDIRVLCLLDWNWRPDWRELQEAVNLVQRRTW